MLLKEIKKQVVSMLQSVLTLDSTQRIEAMGFLKDCAENFGLEIPQQKENVTEAVGKKSSYIEDDSLPLAVLKKKDANNSNLNKCISEIKDESFGEDKTASRNNKLNIEFDTKVNEKIDETNKVDEKDSTPDNCNSKIMSLDKDKEFISLNTTPKNTDLKIKKFTKIQKTRKTTLVTENNKKESKEVFKCPGCLFTCLNKPALLLHFASHSKAPMSCRLCRSHFNNVLHFWRHRKKKECTRPLLKCSECNEKFKYRRHYLKHILGHNDNNCRYCDEKFSTWPLYKHHLKKKHPDVKMERDLIPCKFCSMSFRRHLGLYNHYQTEHSKGKFVCLSCGLLLPTKEKYKEHALVHESEKIWKCKICKMKFYRRQQLLFHVSVHKSGTYKCLTCDITVTSKAELSKHKKEGHEVKGLEPKFECKICHKYFKKNFVLKTHMATHSKEKEFYCKYCVKSFSTLGALQKHQKRKSHFEKAKIILPESKYEKVYEDKLVCENCGKQYNTQRELTWHLRVHKSVYECDECGKTFTLKVNLTKHIKLHSKKNRVVCELCGNTFNQLSALNEHNLMKHSDIRPAECDVCHKKFKRKSELNRHKRIHEQKRPFTCFCGATFNQSSHMQTHFKSFHEKTKQTKPIESENYTNDENNGTFSESIVDRQKPVYLNGEQPSFISLGNMEEDPNFRNNTSYVNVQVNKNHDGKGSFVNNYPLRYSQNEMDSLNVTYEDLNFPGPQPDKREMVFNSPAVDLSMVAISDVVQTDMSLAGARDITDTVENFNKIPDDTSNIQLVNLSEHIVQEYLLNLP